MRRSLRALLAGSRLDAPLSLLVLLAITLLGAYARLKNAGAASSLWFDEAWRIVSLLEADRLFDKLRSSPNFIDPPLFSLIIHGLGRWQATEFCLRMVAIVPGVLTIPLAYLACRRFLTRRWLGLLMSALIAFSPEMMIFSKELKPYALCAFVHLAVLTAFFLCRRDVSRRGIILFTLFIALAIPLAVNILFASSARSSSQASSSSATSAPRRWPGSSRPFPMPSSPKEIQAGSPPGSFDATWRPSPNLPRPLLSFGSPQPGSSPGSIRSSPSPASFSSACAAGGSSSRRSASSSPRYWSWSLST
jgi:hypothetical protein